MGVANKAFTEELFVYTAEELAKVRSGKEAEAGMVAIQQKPPADPYWKTEEMYSSSLVCYSLTS